MRTGTIQQSISVAGMTVTSNATRSAEGQQSHEVTLPAGKSGTLTTRTDDDTGVATLETGHGITTADTVDVYWADGVRYGMSVTDVTGDDVTIDLGSGDVLPAQDVAVIVTPRVTISAAFDGDDVAIIAALCNKRAHVEFLTGASASLLARELTATEAWTWISDTGAANPLTGDAVATLEVSCGVAEEATFQLGVLYDSTP